MLRGWLVVLLACCVAQGAWALDSVGVAQRLIQSRIQKTATGDDRVAGVWVMAKGVAAIQNGNVAEAEREAVRSAREELANFFESTVSGEISVHYDEGESEGESFSSTAKSEFGHRMAGVRTVLSYPEGDTYYAVVMVTEHSADARGALQLALNSDTIKVTGEGLTRDLALANARRKALSQASAIPAGAGPEARRRASITPSILSETVEDERRLDDGRVRVTAVFRISKELKQSYGVDMAEMGEPLFWIVSEDADARQQLSDFLIGKGLKLSLTQASADYLIFLESDYEEVVHPYEGSKGTRLQLSVTCCDISGVQLFALQGDAGQAVSFVGTATRQRQLALKAAVASLVEPLHERLQSVINAVVNNGRSVRIVFRNVTSPSRRLVVEDACNAANRILRNNGASYSQDPDDANAVILRVTLRGNTQSFLSQLRREVPDLPAARAAGAVLAILEF